MTVFIRREKKPFPHLVNAVRAANALLPDAVNEHGLCKGFAESLRLGWIMSGPSMPDLRKMTFKEILHWLRTGEHTRAIEIK